MDLFPDVAGPSPMEAWRSKHGIGLYPTQEGFRAATVRHSAHGGTAEEALLAWADKARVPCWKAEELARLGQSGDPVDAPADPLADHPELPLDPHPPHQ